MSRKKAPARKRTGAFRVKSPGRLHKCPSVPAGSKACMPEKETPPRMSLPGRTRRMQSPGAFRGRKNAAESLRQRRLCGKKNDETHARKIAERSGAEGRSVGQTARAAAEHRAATEEPAARADSKARRRTPCRPADSVRPAGRQKRRPAPSCRRTRPPAVRETGRRRTPFRRSAFAGRVHSENTVTRSRPFLLEE